MKTTTKFWIGIAVLILVSPLGLFLPEYFKAGNAWGEWGPETIEKMAGYVPQGLKKISSFWSAPIPDYAFKGWEEKGLKKLSFAYIFSAILGIAAIVLIMKLIGKLLVKRQLIEK